MSAASVPAVLRSLEAATASNPLGRKLLVCSSTGEGRELLRALAVRGSSWLGWEVTTPRRLALDIAGPDLAAEGLSTSDAFDEEAAIDAALDRALAAPLDGLDPELAGTPGFRDAVANSVRALRLADVAAERVRGTASPSTPAVPTLLAATLEAYLDALRGAGLEDVAAVIRRAADRLEADGAAALGGAVHLLPGLHRRGLPGRLLAALEAAGAATLEADPVEGPRPEGLHWRESADPAPLGRLLAGDPSSSVEPPRLELFAASGPLDELREVLRRVVAQGLRWDEVEIVATDAGVYGSALHVLSERLDIPVSYAVGLPVERTRAGRAAAAWFRWIQGGYPADVIRRLLEAGDLRADDGGPNAMRLARRFRRLRIGWGHDRYLPAIDRAAAALDRRPRLRRDESEADAAARMDREREELRSLRSILDPVLRETPSLDPHAAAERVAPADLARGLAAFLRQVPDDDAPSATARERMLAIADRVAATLDRPALPAAGLAVLRRHLQIRVPAPRREGSAPWTSSGGFLHLTDIEHGGLTGRRAVFVVGMDSERVGGAGLQDPLLLDAQRRALDAAALPTSADQLATARFRMAAMLARLRGAVTLSWSAWDPAAARDVAPSPVVLQAYRSAVGRPDASFEDLRLAIGDAASAIPRTALLDGTDAWFDALHRDGVLLDGQALVRSAFPALDRGLRGREALAGEEATAHHGLVRARPGLDPRGNPDIILSASALEDLGTCGLRYLIKYVLRVRRPEDPELDPDRWLSAMDRGRLLHAVYDRTLREARARGLRAGSDAFVERALAVLDEEAAAMQLEVPPPGRAVLERERAALREDVRSFAAMLEGADQRWEALELRFGLEDRPAAPLEIRGGTVRLRGAIDRIDREGDALVVVDYKTGAAERFERKEGVYHGGRRLQNVVYPAVAAALLDSPVDRMEYHFPTRRGRNEVIAYHGAEIRRGRGLIARLLDLVAAGRFLPTDAGADCRFCDYAAVCRHRVDGWNGETPLADWARDRIGTLDVFQERRDARGWEDLLLAELDGHD